MRLCRYRFDNQERVGFYAESGVRPLADSRGQSHWPPLPIHLPIVEYLPGGQYAQQTFTRWQELQQQGLLEEGLISWGEAELLVPVPRPNKFFLLAGNYAKHIEEGGGQAAAKQDTFPYVFMKPASTTLTDPGQPVRIPRISPAAIDWELELTVVIGTGGKAIPSHLALEHVAGYTIINDVSNRAFRPNPSRKPRERDAFFDWLHGKWHDTFCPCGPCITSSQAIPDPQALQMTLSVNGQVKQDACTSLQIFPVAEVIEFVSNLVTLEPGDLIATGTPSGVGHASGTYLEAGDLVEGWIEGIGTLRHPVESE